MSPIFRKLTDVRQALLRLHKALLTPSEEGQGFARAYFDAIQRNPEIAMLQGQIRKLINSPLAA